MTVAKARRPGRTQVERRHHGAVAPEVVAGPQQHSAGDQRCVAGRRRRGAGAPEDRRRARRRARRASARRAEVGSGPAAQQSNPAGWPPQPRIPEGTDIGLRTVDPSRASVVLQAKRRDSRCLSPWPPVSCSTSTLAWRCAMPGRRERRPGSGPCARRFGWLRTPRGVGGGIDELRAAGGSPGAIRGSCDHGHCDGRSAAAARPCACSTIRTPAAGPADAGRAVDLVGRRPARSPPGRRSAQRPGERGPGPGARAARLPRDCGTRTPTRSSSYSATQGGCAVVRGPRRLMWRTRRNAASGPPIWSDRRPHPDAHCPRRPFAVASGLCRSSSTMADPHGQVEPAPAPPTTRCSCAASRGTGNDAGTAEQDALRLSGDDPTARGRRFRVDGIDCSTRPRPCGARRCAKARRPGRGDRESPARFWRAQRCRGEPVQGGRLHREADPHQPWARPASPGSRRVSNVRRSGLQEDRPEPAHHQAGRRLRSGQAWTCEASRHQPPRLPRRRRPASRAEARCRRFACLAIASSTVCAYSTFLRSGRPSACATTHPCRRRDVEVGECRGAPASRERRLGQRRVASARARLPS